MFIGSLKLRFQTSSLTSRVHGLILISCNLLSSDVWENRRGIRQWSHRYGDNDCASIRTKWLHRWNCSCDFFSLTMFFYFCKILFYGLERKLRAYLKKEWEWEMGELNRPLLILSCLFLITQEGGKENTMKAWSVRIFFIIISILMYV